MRLIVPLLAALSLASTAAIAPQAWAQAGWTWTLYEDHTALALANEIPDTDSLAAVLECTPGSGQAKVSIFPSGKRTSPVVGQYKTTDAAFVAFVASGKLSLKTEAGSGEIAMAAPHLPKLARFSQLCGA